MFPCNSYCLVFCVVLSSLRDVASKWGSKGSEGIKLWALTIPLKTVFAPLAVQNFICNEEGTAAIYWKVYEQMPCAMPGCLQWHIQAPQEGLHKSAGHVIMYIHVYWYMSVQIASCTQIYLSPFIVFVKNIRSKFFWVHVPPPPTVPYAGYTPGLWQDPAVLDLKCCVLIFAFPANVLQVYAKKH